MFRLIKILFSLLLLFLLLTLVSPFVPPLKEPLAPSYNYLKSIWKSVWQEVSAVSPGFFDCDFPAWNTDGTKIAFVGGKARLRGKKSRDLYILNLGDRKLERITKNEWSDFLIFPVFSPQDNFLVFTVAGKAKSEVWLIDVKGYFLKKISPEGLICHTAYSSNIWSPDGERVLFYSQEKSRCRIWIYDIKRQKAQFIPLKQDALFATWTSDGEKIVYQGRVNRASFHIFWANEDGSSVEELTPEGDNRFPVVSRDNTSVLFINYMEKTPCRLGIIDLHSKKMVIFPHIFKEIKNATWSFDAREIIYQARDEQQQWQIYSIDRNGRNKKRITKEANNRYPSWRPRGRRIVFSSNRGWSSWIYSLYLLSTTGGVIERLTPVVSPF